MRPPFALRQPLAAILFLPFLAWSILRFIAKALTSLVVGHSGNVEPDPQSLEVDGMTGKISATVVTLFVDRHVAGSLLPDALTIVDDEQLPGWLRERQDFPLVLLLGSSEIGRRKRILWRWQTVDLFPEFLETFIAVPYVRPKNQDCIESADAPYFHFARVYCEKFWPAELGVMCVGWPKKQYPMSAERRGSTTEYRILTEDRGTVLNASIDQSTGQHEDQRESQPWAVDPQAKSRIIEMLSLPLVLIRRGRLKVIEFNFRFHVARFAPASAAVNLNSAIFPIDDCEPTATQDDAFPSFHLTARFMNRGEI